MILITRGLSFEAGVNYVVINCREFPRVSIALQRDSTVFYGFISWSDCNIFSCLVISECQYFFLNCFLIGGSVFFFVDYKLWGEQLKSSSCTEWLLTLFTPRKAFQAFSKNPNLIILGDDMARRLPIFSLLVNHEDSGRIVHHNFISVLLNDLYGIHARGGCACAGPYAQVGESAFIWVPKRQISAKSQILVYPGVSDAWNLTTRK